MKILHVSSARVDYPGGTEKVILEISTRQALNHEVTILQTNLYEENKKFEPVENRGDIKVITCQNDFFLGGFGYSSDFKKKLRKIFPPGKSRLSRLLIFLRSKSNTMLIG